MPRIASTSSRGLTRIGLKRITEIPFVPSVPMIIDVSVNSTDSKYLKIGGDANVEINWGDGTVETLVTENSFSYPFHQYATTGLYTVTITGVLPQFGGDFSIGIGTGMGQGFIKEVVQWNNTTTNFSWAFEDEDQLTEVPSALPPGVTTTRGMFRGCTSLIGAGIGGWNVSSVTDMSSMFYETLFDQDLSGWCVTNISTEPENFASGTLSPANYPVWGTCPQAISGIAEFSTQTENVTTSNYQYEFFDSSAADFGFGTFTNLVTDDPALLELTEGRTITFNFNGESPLTVTLNSNTSSSANEVFLVWDGSAQGSSPPISITIPGATTVRISSIAGSADDMLAALNTLSINDEFEWTSPLNAVPLQRYTARLMSIVQQIELTWSFRIATVTRPGGGTYSEGYEINRIFIS